MPCRYPNLMDRWPTWVVWRDNEIHSRYHWWIVAQVVTWLAQHDRQVVGSTEVTTPPIKISDEAIRAGVSAYNEADLDFDQPEAVVGVILEAAAPLIAAQVLRPLTRLDIEAAINSLEVSATDPLEPERYREWYAEALDRLRQWQTAAGRSLTEDAP